MLEIINIKKSFNDVPILKGVNFEAKPGALTILEGKNGAGKSTLFNILCGLIKADEGSFFLNGVDLSKLNAEDRAHHIGILRQDPKTSTVPSFSLLENFALALLKNKRASMRSIAKISVVQHVQRHLRDLRLDFDDLNKKVSSFSGGQRQMIGFAMATINKPELLLLDEPSAALDDIESLKLMQLIKYFVKHWQIPVVMISHSTDLNREFGDKIYVLREGTIAFQLA